MNRQYRKSIFNTTTHGLFLLIHDEFKKVFSAHLQLGIMALLCSVCSDWSGVDLVLPAFQVILVF